MRRRIFERPRRKRGALALGQRLRRKTAAVAQRGDGIDIQAALELQHAQNARARPIVVHDPCARGAPAQHIPDQAGDRGAIAGAGIAMRGAPLLERLRRRDALGIDGLDQFDGRGKPGSGSHSKLSLREQRIRSTRESSARNRSTSRTAPARLRTTPASVASCRWRSRKFRREQSA